MPVPLQRVTVPSIYKVNGERVPLPTRLAWASPDMARAIDAVAAALRAKSGRLVLSDLFRSYDMQLQAHLDYVQKRKTAYSPPPGGSLHEAGRALDLDLGSLKMTLAAFWPIARSCGLTPIIAKPDGGADEAWHFECRGSHALVYDYYKAGNGVNFDKPYKAMAASAILGSAIRVDVFGENQSAAYVQSGLIRLGHRLGNMDGLIGGKTREALSAAGITATALPKMVEQVEQRLQAKFPTEFFTATVNTEHHALT